MPMLSTDPVADLLTRLRNSLAVGKSNLQVPTSKLKLEILRVLKSEGYIVDVKKAKGLPESLEVILRAEGKHTKPLLNLKRISKPGRRVYVKSHEIKRVRSGRGLAIISTPQGLMSGQVARKKKLGGELICEVY